MNPVERFRKEWGLSQDELGARIGRDRNSIRRWERQTRLERMQILALLGLTVELRNERSAKEREAQKEADKAELEALRLREMRGRLGIMG